MDRVFFLKTWIMEKMGFLLAFAFQVLLSIIFGMTLSLDKSFLNKAT